MVLQVGPKCFSLKRQHFHNLRLQCTDLIALDRGPRVELVHLVVHDEDQVLLVCHSCSVHTIVDLEHVGANRLAEAELFLQAQEGELRLVDVGDEVNFDHKDAPQEVDDRGVGDIDFQVDEALKYQLNRQRPCEAHDMDPIEPGQGTPGAHVSEAHLECALGGVEIALNDRSHLFQDVDGLGGPPATLIHSLAQVPRVNQTFECASVWDLMNNWRVVPSRGLLAHRSLTCLL